jgi:NADH-quinone oxidoreductase subunit L
MHDSILAWAAVAVVALPVLSSIVLGLFVFVRGAPSERVSHGLVVPAIVGSALALVPLTRAFAEAGPLSIHVGDWFVAGDYGFEVGWLIDRVSLSMAWTVLAIALLVSRFAVYYLHREAGYARFFALLGLCASGLLTVALSAGYDLLFAGWEMVGLSSVLLVLFFHDRPGPARSALWVFTTYRVADVGILVGAVVLHQAAGSTDYDAVFAPGPWPHGGAGAALLVSLLLLLSAMGKSAQFPLGAWLPKAMEGPTPSSALFYGALSVHCGAYLLLRSYPLLERSPIALSVVAVVGLVTAVHAALVGRVQADVKSQLAYATMAQLGVIFVEMGLGLPTLALVHLMAHAFLRGFQLLRAPSALADVRRIRAALQGHELPQATALERRLPLPLARRLYRLALDRFFVEAALERFVVTPVLRLSRALSRADRSVVHALVKPSAPAQAPRRHDAVEGRS